MGEDSARFRGRARQCRTLAADARTNVDRQALSDMADELEAEADLVEAEEAAALKIAIEAKRSANL